MEDCNTAVRRVVRTVLDLGEDDVRPADQTAPAGRQSVAFATVKIINVREIGSPSRRTESDGAGGLNEVLEAPTRVTASVQFWGATSTPARLRGVAVSDDVASYTGVTAGSLSIAIDGAIRSVTGLNFSAALTMEDVRAALEARVVAALAGVAVTWTGKRFLVDSPTSGQASAVGQASVSASATLLGLTAAAGAVGGDNKSGIAKPNMQAFDRARRLVMLLDLSANGMLMQQMGLGFLSASPVRNLAALSDAAFEGRASVDLDFNFIARESVPVPAIAPPYTADFTALSPGPSIAPNGLIREVDISATPT